MKLVVELVATATVYEGPWAGHRVAHERMRYMAIDIREAGAMSMKTLEESVRRNAEKALIPLMRQLRKAGKTGELHLFRYKGPS